MRCCEFKEQLNNRVESDLRDAVRPSAPQAARSVHK